MSRSTWRGQVLESLARARRSKAGQPPVRSRPRAPRKLKPYMDLGEQLGELLAPAIRRLANQARREISLLGANCHEAPGPRPVTGPRAVLRGLLAHLPRRRYDQLRQRAVGGRAARYPGLRRRGRWKSETYHSVLRVRVIRDDGEHVADGSCFGSDPRIVGLDGHPFNIMPVGHLLVWWNTDQPGVIGQVGTLLGELAINIAGMQLGRDAEGGRAISIVDVDAKVPLADLERIRRIRGMIDVRAVSFKQTAGLGNRQALPPMLGK